MKFLLIFHALTSLILFAAIGNFYGQAAAVSFAMGAGLMFFNLAMLVYSWPRILAKKTVALPLGVIVIKFLILGYIVHLVVGSPSVHLWWFAAGLALVVSSTMATSVYTSLETSSGLSKKVEN